MRHAGVQQWPAFEHPACVFRLREGCRLGGERRRSFLVRSRVARGELEPGELDDDEDAGVVLSLPPWTSHVQASDRHLALLVALLLQIQ